MQLGAGRPPAAGRRVPVDLCEGPRHHGPGHLPGRGLPPPAGGDNLDIKLFTEISAPAGGDRGVSGHGPPPARPAPDTAAPHPASGPRSVAAFSLDILIFIKYLEKATSLLKAPTIHYIIKIVQKSAPFSIFQ